MRKLRPFLEVQCKFRLSVFDKLDRLSFEPKANINLQVAVFRVICKTFCGKIAKCNGKQLLSVKLINVLLMTLTFKIVLT